MLTFMMLGFLSKIWATECMSRRTLVTEDSQKTPQTNEPTRDHKTQPYLVNSEVMPKHEWFQVGVRGDVYVKREVRVCTHEDYRE